MESPNRGNTAHSSTGPRCVYHYKVYIKSKNTEARCTYVSTVCCVETFRYTLSTINAIAVQ